MIFCCPKCMQKLLENGRSAVCRNGHSYDRARGGYYNLLQANRGGTHGDNKEMVLARRSFLGAGFYAPLADRVSALVLEHTAPCSVILDAGCGEGYYTDKLETAVFERDGESRVAAFDISKEAVREVRRKNSHIELAVAGSYSMPVADGTVDTLINTFSPLALSEVVRTLKVGGVFIMAIPGVEHLFELKAAIYDTPYKNTVDETRLEGLSLISDVSLTYGMALSTREAVSSLFRMTPYAYRTSPENCRRVENIERLDCTADFRILVYKKP